MIELLQPYLIISLSMVVLSLWKTYSGPLIAGMMSYSYPEMLLFNLMPAIIAGYIGWRVIPIYTNFSKRRAVSGFNPKLKRFMKIWNKYGQVSIALLAPILIGIPSYTIISKRLNQNRNKTFFLLTISILFWVSLIYFSVALFELDQNIVLDDLLPSSVINKISL